MRLISVVRLAEGMPGGLLRDRRRAPWRTLWGDSALSQEDIRYAVSKRSNYREIVDMMSMERLEGGGRGMGRHLSRPVLEALWVWSKRNRCIALRVGVCSGRGMVEMVENRNGFPSYRLTVGGSCGI